VQDFDAHFKPDDFSLVPVTVVQTTKRAVEEGEYESCMTDWLRAYDANKANVLFVFIEEALAHPERVLDKICAFIGEDVSQSRKDEILSAVTGMEAAKLQRAASMTFTPTQLKLITLKFALEEQPPRQADDPGMMVAKMAAASGGGAIHARYGVFATDGVDDECGAKFTNLGIANIQEVFKQLVAIGYCGDQTADYQSLYTKVTGLPYPAPPAQTPERRATMTERMRGSVYRAAVPSEAAAGFVKTEAVISEEEEEEDAPSAPALSPTSTRRTLASRLWKKATS
jgi:hypothetical protein